MSLKFPVTYSGGDGGYKEELTLQRDGTGLQRITAPEGKIYEQKVKWEQAGESIILDYYQVYHSTTGGFEKPAVRLGCRYYLGESVIGREVMNGTYSLRSR